MSDMELKLNWDGTKEEKGKIEGEALNVGLTIPDYYTGEEPGTNPKELLVSSAATCYFMTLVVMLEARHFPITNIEMSTQASTDGGNIKISHYPVVTLANTASEKDFSAAERTLIGADKACAVGNLLRKAEVEINLHGEVKTEQ